jgi:hypothetical protein
LPILLVFAATFLALLPTRPQLSTEFIYLTYLFGYQVMDCGNNNWFGSCSLAKKILHKMSGEDDEDWE